MAQTMPATAFCGKRGDQERERFLVLPLDFRNEHAGGEGKGENGFVDPAHRA